MAKGKKGDAIAHANALWTAISKLYEKLSEAAYTLQQWLKINKLDNEAETPLPLVDLVKAGKKSMQEKLSILQKIKELYPEAYDAATDAWGATFKWTK
jgi:uncharacterized membrane protein